MPTVSTLLFPYHCDSIITLYNDQIKIYNDILFSIDVVTTKITLYLLVAFICKKIISLHIRTEKSVILTIY